MDGESRPKEWRRHFWNVVLTKNVSYTNATREEPIDIFRLEELIILKRLSAPVRNKLQDPVDDRPDQCISSSNDT